MRLQQATDSTVCGVLPLCAGDLDRVRLLFATFERFSLPLASLHLVASNVDVARRLEARVPASWGARVEITTDDALFGGRPPGLSPDGLIGRIAHRGWYVQQMIKLLVAARAPQRFCLTLDADVLLVRDVQSSDLVERGRARTVVLPALRHRVWARVSGQLLRVPPPSIELGVTPCLLHTRTCAALLERLGRRRRHTDAPVPEASAIWPTTARRAPSGPPAARQPWARRLAWRWGWSEYALYLAWASHTRSFDLHHTSISYDDWFAPSVWHPRDWASWPGFGTRAAQTEDHRAATSAARPLFAVVQSTAAPSVAAVAARVGIQ